MDSVSAKLNALYKQDTSLGQLLLDIKDACLGLQEQGSIDGNPLQAGLIIMRHNYLHET